MILNKYAAALLSIALVVVGAVAVVQEFTIDAVAQLTVLAVGAVVTYLVPVLPSGWAGLFKTGAAIVAAAVTALVPVFTNSDYTPQSIAVAVLAVLNALAVEVGVNIRKDDLRLAT